MSLVSFFKNVFSGKDDEDQIPESRNISVDAPSSSGGYKQIKPAASQQYSQPIGPERPEVQPAQPTTQRVPVTTISGRVSDRVQTDRTSPIFLSRDTKQADPLRNHSISQATGNEVVKSPKEVQKMVNKENFPKTKVFEVQKSMEDSRRQFSNDLRVGLVNLVSGVFSGVESNARALGTAPDAIFSPTTGPAVGEVKKYIYNSQIVPFVEKVNTLAQQSIKKMVQSRPDLFEGSKELNQEPTMDAFMDNLKNHRGELVSQVIGQNLPTYGAALLSSVFGGVVAGMSVMGLSASGETYEEAQEKGVPKDEAARTALLRGVIEASLEKLPLDEFLKVKGGGRVIQNLKDEMFARIKDTLKVATSESMTEVAQEVAANTIAKSYDKDRGFWDNAATSAFGGFLLGGAGGFIASEIGSNNGDIPQVVQDSITKVQEGAGIVPSVFESAVEKAKSEAEIDPATLVDDPTIKLQNQRFYQPAEGSVATITTTFNAVLPVAGDQMTLIQDLAEAGVPEAQSLLKDFDYFEADSVIRKALLGTPIDAVQFTTRDVGPNGEPTVTSELFDLQRNVFLQQDRARAEELATEGYRSKNVLNEPDLEGLPDSRKQARAATESQIRQFASRNELPVRFVREMFVTNAQGQLVISPTTGRPIRAFGAFNPQTGEITITDTAKGTTAKHEVAEFYWDRFVEQDRKAEILAEARKKFGDKPDNVLKEEVMDAFAEYRKTGKTTLGTKIKKFFDDILKFIKQLSGIKPDAMQQFFEDIENRVRPQREVIRRQNLAPQFQSDEVVSQLGPLVQEAQRYETQEEFIEEGVKPFHSLNVYDLERIKESDNRLVAPSFGIAKSIDPIEEFGDITLVVPMELFDRTRTFTRDIASPRPSDLPENLYLPSKDTRAADIIRQFADDPDTILNDGVKDSVGAPDAREFIDRYYLSGDNGLLENAQGVADALGMEGNFEYDDSYAVVELLAEALFERVEKTPEGIQRYMDDPLTADIVGQDFFSGIGAAKAAEELTGKDLIREARKRISKSGEVDKAALLDTQLTVKAELAEMMGREGPDLRMVTAGELAAAQTYNEFRDSFEENFGQDAEEMLGNKKEAKSIYNKLRRAFAEIPTEYFESKATGSFDLNEFPVAIARTEEAKSALREIGFTGEIINNYAEFYDMATGEQVIQNQQPDQVVYNGEIYDVIEQKGVAGDKWLISRDGDEKVVLKSVTESVDALQYQSEEVLPDPQVKNSGIIVDRKIVEDRYDIPEEDLVDRGGGKVSIPFYHGSSGRFDAFDLSKSGTIQKSDWGRGVYLTPSRVEARRYANEASRQTNDVATISELYVSPDARIKNIYNAMASRSDDSLSDDLIRQGYDGAIIFDGTGEDTILSEVIIVNPDVLSFSERPLSLTDIKKEFADLDLVVSESENEIKLSKVVVPVRQRNEGTGTQFMNRLVEYADSAGKRIVLTPTKDFGASSVKRLTDFYKRFGFVENKGKNKDFSTRETMIRQPQVQKLYQAEEVIPESERPNRTYEQERKLEKLSDIKDAREREMMEKEIEIINAREALGNMSFLNDELESGFREFEKLVNGKERAFIGYYKNGNEKFKKLSGEWLLDTGTDEALIKKRFPDKSIDTLLFDGANEMSNDEALDLFRDRYESEQELKELANQKTPSEMDQISKKKIERVVKQVKATKTKIKKAAKTAGEVKIPNNKVEVSEKSLLKDRIKRFSKGVKEGRVGMKKEIQAIAKEAVSQAREKLSTADQGKVLTQVARAVTPDQLTKALDRISEIAEISERREAVSEIKKVIKKTKKSGKTGSSIAVDYQKRILEAVKDFDPANPTQATLNKLQGLSDYLKTEQGQKANISKRYIDQLDRLGKKSPADMTTQELKELAQTLNHLVELGKTKLKLLQNASERQKQESLSKLLETTRNLDGSAKLRVNNWDKFKAGAKRLYFGSMHFFRVADAIDGYMEYKGQNVQMQRMAANAETVAKIQSQNTIIDVMEKVNEIKQDWNEQDQAAISYLMMSEMGAETQAEIIVQEYGQDIVERSKSDEMAQVANILRDAFKMRQEELGAVFEEIENKPFDYVEKYFPIKYEKATDQLKEEPKWDELLARGGFKTTKTEQGFTKSRKKNVKKLPRIDVFNIFSEAIQENLWYMNVQPVINNIKGLVYSDDYQSVAGQTAVSLWESWLSNLSRAGKTYSAIPFVKGLRFNLGQAVLGYKLTSVAIQPFAIFEAVAYVQQMTIENGSSKLAAAEVVKEFTKSWVNPWYAGKAKTESEMLRLRAGGEWAIQEGLDYFDPAKRGNVLSKGYGKFQRGALKVLQIADIKTAAGVRQGVYKALIRSGMSEELANKEADFIMNIVSSSSEVADRPVVLSNELGKVAFTFQSYALNLYGLVFHDIVRSGIVGGKMTRKASALASLAIIIFGQWLADESRDMINKITRKNFKDRKNRPADTVVWDMLLFIPETLPVIGNMLKSGRKYGQFDFGVPVMRPVSQALEGMIKLFEADTPEKRDKALAKLGEGLASMFGVSGTAQLFDVLPNYVPSLLPAGSSNKKKSSSGPRTRSRKRRKRR